MPETRPLEVRLERILESVAPPALCRQHAQDILGAVRPGRQLLVSWAEPGLRRQAGLLPLIAMAATRNARLVVVMADPMARSALLERELPVWLATAELHTEITLLERVEDNAPKDATLLIMTPAVFLSRLQEYQLHPARRSVQPPDLLYIEDAQLLPDLARDHLTQRLDLAAISLVLAPLAMLGHGRLAESVRGLASRFFEDLARHRRSATYKVRLTEQQPIPNFELLDGLEAAAQVLDQVWDEASTQLAARSRQIIEAISAAMELTNSSLVHHIRADHAGGVSLCSIPLELKSLFAPIWRASFAVLAGPALDSASAFTYLHTWLEFGAHARQLVGAGPDRPLLVIAPEGLFDPAEREWVGLAEEATLETLELLPGPVLGIFGSRRLRDRLRCAAEDIPCIRSGDRAEDSLPTEASGLYTTGEQLLLEPFPRGAWGSAVLDRLPFPRANEPVHDALQALESAWFYAYALPRAALAFRSLVAELSASSAAPGVLLLLDSRLFSRAYASSFLEGLSSVTLTRSVENLISFLHPGREVRP